MWQTAKPVKRLKKMAERESWSYRELFPGSSLDFQAPELTSFSLLSDETFWSFCTRSEHTLRERWLKNTTSPTPNFLCDKYIHISINILMMIWEEQNSFLPQSREDDWKTETHLRSWVEGEESEGGASLHPSSVEMMKGCWSTNDSTYMYYYTCKMTREHSCCMCSILWPEKTD